MAWAGAVLLTFYGAVQVTAEALVELGVIKVPAKRVPVNRAGWLVGRAVVRVGGVSAQGRLLEMDPDHLAERPRGIRWPSVSAELAGCSSGFVTDYFWPDGPTPGTPRSDIWWPNR